MTKRYIYSYICRLLLVCISAVILFTTAVPTVYADELSDKISQKEDIDNELSDIEDEINDTQDAIDDALSDIENSKNEQALQEAKKNQIIEELKSLMLDIESLDEEIEKSEKDLREKETLFFERAKKMYRYSDYSMLDLLLESENIFDFFDKLNVYRKILKTDRELMNELISARNTLASKKELQSTIFADKETLLAETEKAIEAIENDREIIQSDYEALTEAINQLAAREEELIQSSDELQGDIDYLENQQNNNGSAPYEPSESGFIFPLESYVYLSSPFGYRTHPITGQPYSFHSGIDLAAYGGTPIYASADGIVTVAVPVDNGGYGLWVEIEHSNGMRTRYAHCNYIYVKVGDTVRQGQTIAEVGTTGSSTGNHLHYEVLVSGSQQNPLNYVSLP